MNGRQSGAVRYLASLSLDYYSPGLPRRPVSSSAFVVPRSFCLPPVSSSSLFLYLLSVPSFKTFSRLSFSFRWPDRQAARLLSLCLFRFNGLSRSFAGDQVRRYRWQDIMHNLFLRVDSRCAFCTRRARAIRREDSRLFSRHAESFRRFRGDFPGWRVVTIWKRESRNRKPRPGISSEEFIKCTFPRRKRAFFFREIY